MDIDSSQNMHLVILNTQSVSKVYAGREFTVIKENELKQKGVPTWGVLVKVFVIIIWNLMQFLKSCFLFAFQEECYNIMRYNMIFVEFSLLF